MPELPEVETSRRGIDPHVSGRTVTKTIVRQGKLRWPVPVQIISELSGQTILGTDRRGKYLLLNTAAGCLIIHLGMSGSVRIVDNSQPAGKHDHVDIEFTGGVILRYHDPRRFGCILWSAHPSDQHPLLRDLGPEPLSEEFTADYLFARSRGRKTPIKSFIMDSHVVVGVGNIYANEALFMAGIRPQAEAGAMSRARLQRLVASIKEVIAHAITVGGTTLRDFVGGDGKPGYFQQSLRVYGRGGEACKSCGSVLKEIRQTQRSSVYCARCQR
ncbi:MAG: bifunctional DNA-formamidopyrimidine glycosylase/DNA-(apurinic or apyrimidinic site) lyase [Pseudohongiella sp.]|nr:bifunctional DNA-formamidopyrimidine glycosylase/DNA-(apurinic or apyrimidinic site) lyase [Pseudohongiella sp.]MDO9521123.1 bifunctional DNA-formamidopyrimidine glycosylase/DNA-(apurinic or apyrimidinic site) lyase [Pseudohongiella sp.]MDP2126702.1 bifunctional DNA-formamidopyrimidine glycosylase/DNA-(apurinic or apyrimidinic site) lyase [Pseudohongiella sp.]